METYPVKVPAPTMVVLRTARDRLHRARVLEDECGEPSGGVTDSLRLRPRRKTSLAATVDAALVFWLRHHAPDFYDPATMDLPDSADAGMSQEGESASG